MPETLIYKYRDWNNNFHKKVLTERQFYFASGDTFNDPFDEGIPIRYDLLTAEQFADNMISSLLRNDSNVSKYDLEESRKNMIEGWKNDFPEEYIQRVVIEEQKRQQQRIGIVSFSRLSNNILMWSHYASNHTGFCIGIDVSYIESNEKLLLKNVKYQNKYPVIIPSTDSFEDMVKSFYIKSELWKYENEVRLIKHINETQIIQLPKEAFRAIYFGCNTSQKHKKEIILATKDTFPNLEYFQYLKNKEAFKLDEFILEESDIQQILK